MPVDPKKLTPEEIAKIKKQEKARASEMIKKSGGTSEDDPASKNFRGKIG